MPPLMMRVVCAKSPLKIAWWQFCTPCVPGLLLTIQNHKRGLPVGYRIGRDHAWIARQVLAQVRTGCGVVRLTGDLNRAATVKVLGIRGFASFVGLLQEGGLLGDMREECCDLDPVFR